MVLSNDGERTDVSISLNPKEMQQAYEIRAALEEVAGRAAASVLKGNTAQPINSVFATSVGFSENDGFPVGHPGWVCFRFMRGNSWQWRVSQNRCVSEE
jgi:hypothetical protein